MTHEHIEELANSLEDHGTNRADFRDANDAQLYQVARWLHLARAQVNASNAPDDTLEGTRAYSDHLIDKKNRYFHACGHAGIGVKEANSIWWSVVYDGLAPYRRTRNV